MNTDISKIGEFLPIIVPYILLHFILVLISLRSIYKNKEVKNLSIPIWVAIIILFQVGGSIAYLLVGRVEE